MARLWARFWVVPLLLLVGGVGDVAAPLNNAATAQQPASSSNRSWTESISSGFKQGADKVGRTLNPKPSAPEPGREDDAVSLKSKAKPGAGLYIALARVYEQSGKTAEAEQQYQLALKEKPDDLTALLAYAQLEEYLGRPTEAIRLYQRAVKAHPQQASVHNNLGLCYARQNRLDDAVASIGRAIELAPKNALYRNNMATVLVDQGKLREALGQLREVHGEAVAYYNLGYLLNKKGQTQAAMQNFLLALKADPSMDAARRWAEYLHKPAAQARLAQHPAGIGVKITSPPLTPTAEAPMPPYESAPRRLPPTVLRQPSLDGPSLPGISYDRPIAPAAPMPPPPSNSALRPLPRVN